MGLTCGLLADKGEFMQLHRRFRYFRFVRLPRYWCVVAGPFRIGNTPTSMSTSLTIGRISIVAVWRDSSRTGVYYHRAEHGDVFWTLVVGPWNVGWTCRKASLA